MSPRVLKVGELVFWFHSYDAAHESRASVHVGRGAQNDVLDAKIWLEPDVEVARSGRTLTISDLRRAIRTVVLYREQLLEAWYDYRGRIY
jgi:hypothetical protein